MSKPADKSSNDLLYEALQAMRERGLGAKITVNGQEYKTRVHLKAELALSHNQSAPATPTGSTLAGGANSQTISANSRGQSEASVSTDAASGGTSSASAATTASSASTEGSVGKVEKKEKPSMLDV